MPAWRRRRRVRRPRTPRASGRPRCDRGSSGVRCSGGAASASRASSRARRSDCGRSIVDRPSTASRSNATNRAGVSTASFAMRDAAGWMRCCSASKSSPRGDVTTISPSRTQPSGSGRVQRLLEFGEVAVQRLQVAALQQRRRRRRERRARESRPTSARTGSRARPGSASATLASIGSMGGTGWSVGIAAFQRAPCTDVIGRTLSRRRVSNGTNAARAGRARGAPRRSLAERQPDVVLRDDPAARFRRRHVGELRCAARGP